MSGAYDEAPRSLLRRILTLVDEGTGEDSHDLVGSEPLEPSEMSLLLSLGVPLCSERLSEVNDFEWYLSQYQVWKIIPFWETSQSGESHHLQPQQPIYRPRLRSNAAISREDGLEIINEDLTSWRLRPWMENEAEAVVKALSAANAYRFRGMGAQRINSSSLTRKLKDEPSSLIDQDAAALIQTELVQEVNNNQETLFPEKEHVWEFAAARVIPSINCSIL
ncbi:hypothetical protein BJ878DRAFT_483050 [Calycina marina]|uniref:Uncharacterized protein n=1 Tax=Calycina marina TaxID=1763456 RepID=A0A9P8CBU7_9HELO|nr:hypothetical protein BJ878DRAFT_483050 [Calycina marina]